MVVKRIDGGLERVAMVGMFAEVCVERERAVMNEEKEENEGGERRGRTKETNEGEDCTSEGVS